MRSAARKEQIKMVIYNDFFNFIHHYEEHRQNISFIFCLTEDHWQKQMCKAEKEDSESKL
jgi:hypothetical protein